MVFVPTPGWVAKGQVFGRNGFMQNRNCILRPFAGDLKNLPSARSLLFWLRGGRPKGRHSEGSVSLKTKIGSRRAISEKPKKLTSARRPFFEPPAEHQRTDIRKERSSSQARSPPKGQCQDPQRLPFGSAIRFSSPGVGCQRADTRKELFLSKPTSAPE